MSADLHIEEASRRVAEARRKALAHPLRHRICSMLTAREASPTELAEELGEPFPNVDYHVRYLAGRTKHNDVPLIELVDTDRRRGGTQHFYRAIERPSIGPEDARGLPLATREDGSAAVIDGMVEDFRVAQAAETIDVDELRTLWREHLRFDEEAIEASAELFMEFREKLLQLAAESANRSAADGRPLHAVATNTAIFRVPGVYPSGT